MGSQLTSLISPRVADAPVGFVSNKGRGRYLLEAESSTGFVAWKLADGTTLVSEARQVSLVSSQSVSFWSCASYTDTTLAGHIITFDCHGNSLTSLDVRALTGLRYLDCSFNQLTKLNLNGLTELEVLEAESNRLRNLNARSLRALRVLDCANNRLTRLHLFDPTRLQVLDCYGNPIASLKLDGCDAPDGSRTAKAITRSLRHRTRPASRI
jgi:hypothetical protein